VTITQFAKRQLADYDRHRPGTLFEDRAIELTVGESYALQFEVARLREARGERVAGYKIGCISPVMQLLASRMSWMSSLYRRDDDATPSCPEELTRTAAPLMLTSLMPAMNVPLCRGRFWPKTFLLRTFQHVCTLPL
jgi:hypothetical protein